MKPALSPFPASLVLTPLSRRPTVLPDATVAAAMSNDIHIVRARAPRRARPRTPKVSIVVVTLDNIVFLRLCVASVLSSSREHHYELIIVDNGSTDGTGPYLQEIESMHPDVRVIRNPQNAGFAAGTNQGLAVAKGDVLVLLNDDTMVPPGWLSDLCRHLGNQSIGMVGPVTNRAGNESQIETSYRTYGEFIAFASARRSAWHGSVRDVPMLTMFCLAMRRDVFDHVGQLDEQFAIGMFEDDDYALRVRQASLRIVCAQDLFVHHFGATSLGKLAAWGQFGTLFDANKRRFEAKWQRTWYPRSRQVSAEYRQLVDRIRGAVDRCVPPESRIAVVSRGDERLLDLPACTGLHFPQDADGTYAGYHPSDSDEAIRQIESAWNNGTEYFLVPATMRWWLDFYPDLNAYLRAHGRLILDDEVCVLFALDAGEKPAERPGASR